jgi:hypothetical protein
MRARRKSRKFSSNWSISGELTETNMIVSLYFAAIRARFLFGALLSLAALSCVFGAERQVVIDLSAQRASLIDQGRVVLCSPIASGKEGWRTPTGHFRIIAKDANHRSGSFGSVVDSSGQVINGNATPSSPVPRGAHYEPAPMPYFMEFAPMVGMHAGRLPGYPASHGCVRMPHDLVQKFYSEVAVGMPVTVVGNSLQASRVRAALPVGGVPGERLTIVSLHSQKRIATASKTAFGWSSASRTIARNSQVLFTGRSSTR